MLSLPSVNVYSTSDKQKVSALPPPSQSHKGATSLRTVCDLFSRLGQEFANGFSDVEKLEPCVTFMARFSGQIVELFCVDR